ncbi:MAG: hypothetical protein ACOVQX_05485 [Legionella sp.]
MIITGDNALPLKKIVLEYIQGETILGTRLLLEDECNKKRLNADEIFKSIPIKSLSIAPGEDEHADEIVINILSMLNITNDKLEYNNLINSESLYEFLMKLSHDGNEHITYLLKIIEKTKPEQNWSLIYIYGTVISTLLGVFFYVQKDLLISLINWLDVSCPTLIIWLAQTFSVLRNIPLLGILFNSGKLLWDWHQTLANGTTLTQEKYSILLFSSLTTGLTIIAYLLSYLADGTMTIPATVLFIISTSIDIFKNLFEFFKAKKAITHLVPPHESEMSWRIHAQYERDLNKNKKLVESSKISIIAATSSTLTIIMWGILPANLVLTISYLTIITLIDLTKKSLIDNMDDTYAAKLQDLLRKRARSTPYDHCSARVSIRERADQQEQSYKQGIIDTLNTLIKEQVSAADALRQFTHQETVVNCNQQLTFITAPNIPGSHPASNQATDNQQPQQIPSLFQGETSLSIFNHHNNSQKTYPEQPEGQPAYHL